MYEYGLDMLDIGHYWIRITVLTLFEQDHGHSRLSKSVLHLEAYIHIYVSLICSSQFFLSEMSSISSINIVEVL